jgi:hypothetical protein
VFACALCGVLTTASVALADHDDVKTACADFRNATAGYQSDVVTASFNTTEPSCKNITYSLVIIIDEGEQVTYSVPGSGANPLTIRSDPITTDADSTVCVYLTASRGGRDGLNRILDRMPDEGCTTLTEEGAGGDIGHA